MAGVVSKQPVKETTFPLQAEEPGTEGKQPDVKTDAYDLADTDLTVWYEDPSYEDFFEYAVRQYFEQTGVKAAFKCQDTLDYIGMIYDNTMQGEDYPDVYLLNGDELEEAYLYGLAMENEDGGSYEGASQKSVKASTYEDKMIGYPLSYDASVFVYQNGYFENQPESLQAIIDYSNENEPGENVEYLLEWDVNDAFYDFPFVGNSVTFEKTAPETADFLYDLALRIGKKPVRVNKDAKGFLANRLQLAVLREALHIVESGIGSPEDVDACMKYGLGLRYAGFGPFEVCDFGGLDTFYHISEYLFPDLSDAKEPFGLLQDRFERGEYGVKTQRGFYVYEDGKAEAAIARRDKLLAGISAAAEQG